LLLDDAGGLYSTGDNSFGQLGLGDRDDRYAPEKISGFSVKARFIACGFFHSAVISDVMLYTCGQGICGQLGHGDGNDRLSLTPVEAMPSSKLSTVACGYSHSSLLTDTGDVFTWGNNYYGQLGLGHKKDQFKPQIVRQLSGKHIIAIKCGSFHTIAQTDLHNVIYWGRGVSKKSHMSSRNLASTSSAKSDESADPLDVSIPSLYEALHGKECYLTASGPNHNVGVSASGHVYIWGSGLRPDGAVKVDSRDPDSPIVVASFHGRIVKQVACGENFCLILTGPSRWDSLSLSGCSRIFLLFIIIILMSLLLGGLENGNMYSFGSGESGQLGLGTTKTHHVPRRILFDILAIPATKESYLFVIQFYQFSLFLL
jgi:hypothetical protein